MSLPLKLAWGSVAVGIVVLALKFAAFWLTGSIALYSDALESSLGRTAMRISPTIIHISIRIAFGLALATGAMAQATDKDRVVVILRPGLEKGQIETALDAARDTGRPVTRARPAHQRSWCARSHP
jgi:hypothetical protein